MNKFEQDVQDKANDIVPSGIGFIASFAFSQSSSLSPILSTWQAITNGSIQTDRKRLSTEGNNEGCERFPIKSGADYFLPFLCLRF